MKNIVFVADAGGVWHQHGPVRSSEAQAAGVARLLAKRLGWRTVAAGAAPSKVAPDKGGPSATQAGTSPVWKDAALAARWEAGKRGAVAPAPVAAPARRERRPKAAPVAPAAPVADAAPVAEPGV